MRAARVRPSVTCAGGIMDSYRPAHVTVIQTGDVLFRAELWVRSPEHAPQNGDAEVGHGVVPPVPPVPPVPHPAPQANIPELQNIAGQGTPMQGGAIGAIPVAGRGRGISRRLAEMKEVCFEKGQKGSFRTLAGA